MDFGKLLLGAAAALLVVKALQPRKPSDLEQALGTAQLIAKGGDSVAKKFLNLF